MISQGDSLDQGAGVPVPVQSRIEQERRGYHFLLSLALMCLLATLAVAAILRRCDREPVNIHDPVLIDQVKSNWTAATNTDGRPVVGEAGP